MTARWLATRPTLTTRSILTGKPAYAIALAGTCSFGDSCRTKKPRRLQPTGLLIEAPSLREKGRDRLGVALRRLRIARRHERSNDEKQTHDTGELGHGETPSVSPRATSKLIEFPSRDSSRDMTIRYSLSRFVKRSHSTDKSAIRIEFCPASTKTGAEFQMIFSEDFPT